MTGDDVVSVSASPAGGGLLEAVADPGLWLGGASLGRFAREVTRGGQRYRVEFDLLNDVVFVVPVSEVSLADLISGARTVRITGLGGGW